MIHEAERNTRGLVGSISVNKGRLLAALWSGASLLSTATAFAQSNQAAASHQAAPPATSSTPIEAPDLAQGAAVEPSATAQSGAAVQPNAEAAPAVKPPPLDESEFEPRTKWYGWQNLVMDGSAVSLIALATASETPALSVAGMLTYVAGSPIVHWAHGNVGTGFGSLAMRVAAFATFAGGSIACASNSLDDSSSDGGGCAVAAIGILLVPAAMAVDAAVLAYDDVPPKPTASSHLLPWVNKQREAVGVSWLGRF